MNIREHALRFHDAGLSVIPTKYRTKKAAVPWERYQSQRPPREAVVNWFHDRSRRGIGIVCGPVSGNLVVRDFDRIESYRNWQERFPGLADRLPTVETSRGYHTWARSADLTLPNGATIFSPGDGEVRAGGIVLAPESIHPSGKPYRFTVPLEDEIPQIALSESGFFECWSRNRPLGAIQDPSQNPSDTIRHIACVLMCPKAIETAISSTLPTGPGQRNRCVFKLVQRLKRMDPDKNPNDLRHVVQEWHQRALPFIRTKPFSETWQDFLIGWERCSDTMALGLETALAGVDAMPIPPSAAHHDSPEMIHLIRVCMALQSATGNQPFFLSVRKASEIIGVSKSDAQRMLKTLELEGFLHAHNRGTKATGRATEWYWTP